MVNGAAVGGHVGGAGAIRHGAAVNAHLGVVVAQTMGSDASFKNKRLCGPFEILACERFKYIRITIVIPAIKVWTFKNRFFIKDSDAIICHTMSILLAIIIHMSTSRRYYTIVCKKVVMCTYHNYEGIV